jgi:uncharacterized protein YjbI with pentapeptide repeats
MSEEQPLFGKKSASNAALPAQPAYPAESQESGHVNGTASFSWDELREKPMLELDTSYLNQAPSPSVAPWAGEDITAPAAPETVPQWSNMPQGDSPFTIQDNSQQYAVDAQSQSYWHQPADTGTVDNLSGGFWGAGPANGSASPHIETQPSTGDVPRDIYGNPLPGAHSAQATYQEPAPESVYANMETYPDQPGYTPTEHHYEAATSGGSSEAETTAAPSSYEEPQTLEAPIGRTEEIAGYDVPQFSVTEETGTSFVAEEDAPVVTEPVYAPPAIDSEPDYAISPVESVPEELAEPEYEEETITYDPEVVQGELALMATQHRLWLESGGREGKRAAFRGTKFRQADFSGLMLVEASFRGASLAGTSFRNADLAGADFAEADISRSQFGEANLANAKLRNAKLNYADFSNANLNGADLARSEAEGARFSQAQMQGAVLRDANLASAVLLHAQMAQANLRGTQLQGALLEGTNLYAADCRDANFERARFVGANVEEAQFRNADFTHVDMNDTDFTKAIDVSPEYHVQSAQNERGKLQEEFEKLETLRRELENRERQLNQNRQALQRAQQAMTATTSNSSTDQKILVLKMKSASRWFGIAGLIWLVMIVILAAATAAIILETGASKLNLMQMGLLGAILLVPAIIFVISMLKSFSVNRWLKKCTPAETPAAVPGKKA